MTIQFLPLAESLEAQKLLLGDSEFVWTRWVDGNVVVLHQDHTPMGDILGPAYLPCEIKAGIWGAVNLPDKLQVARYGGLTDETYIARFLYWEGKRRETAVLRGHRGTAPTEALALFALWKKIKEAE